MSIISIEIFDDSISGMIHVETVITGIRENFNVIFRGCYGCRTFHIWADIGPQNGKIVVAEIKNRGVGST